MTGRNRAGAALLALAAAACAALPRGPAGPGELSLLRRASRLFDGRTRAEIGWEEALDRLAQADVVFLGETHLDLLTHEAEQEFLAGLHERRAGEVTLSLEMFERDVQPALDDYLAGRTGEAEFLARSRPWRNYRSDYRPLVELARRAGIPVVAANFPAELRMRLSRGGEEALAALTASERAFVPERLIDPPPEYWERVANVTRGHGALGMGGGGGRFDGQSLWDNAMADAIARELESRPGRLVVHVCGSFHADRWQGAVWQLLQRREDARIGTVLIQASGDLAGTRIDDAEPRADVIVRVEARARSEQDGAAAVMLPHEQRYRLRLPGVAAEAVPLLVWLGGDGETLDDGFALWEPLLGAECALLVVEPTHPHVGEDGIRRGRWYFAGGLDEGGDLAAVAVERILEVALRAAPEGAGPQPSIDRERVVLAGERAGAAMAICAARGCDRARFHALAFGPTGRDELPLMALPLPPGLERPHRTLDLFDREERAAEWLRFAERDAELRLETTVVPYGATPAERERVQVDATRRALGLPPLPGSAGADELLGASPDGPRAGQFARIQARRARAAGLERAPSLEVTAAAFADGTRLPLASGAFGGTTIVVLPDAADDDEIAAWARLEQPDVLQRRSRFHRLRVAHGGGERSPRAVIERLRTENPQRRDFLLVPARFAAEEPEVRALRAGLGPLAEELRLEILPGLGDRLEPMPPADPHPGTSWRERLERASASTAAWRSRSEEIRRQILVSSGLWPEPERQPVAAELTDRVEREGYCVENVRIETLPGFKLSGTLYRPLGRSGPHPAVVSPHGHWADGRFNDSSACSVPGRAINLARLGIVVLTYDMVGFGDLAPLGHRFGDPPWAASLQGLQLWNSLRAVDFLVSLPDVDAGRLGATGASGGGTQTFLLAAVDPRIRVSVPVNMVAAAFQGGCLCENAPLLRIDLNNVEIAAAIAPRPLLLIACTGDWTAENPTLEAPVVQAVYEKLGAPDRFRCVQIDADHNYNRDTREVVYAWLARWLLDAPATDRIPETPFSAEARASTSPRPAGALESAAAELRARAVGAIEALRPRDARSAARYRELYRPAWAHSLGARVPASGEVATSKEGDDLHASYRPLPDRVVLRPLAGGAGPRIWVAASEDEAAVAPAGPGWLLVLREHAPEPACNDGLEFRDAGWRESLERFPSTYYRSELGRRVQDVLTALAAVPGAELAGAGGGGAIALLARGLSPGPATIDLEGVEESALAAGQPNYLALGGLRGAALLSAGRPLSLRRPTFDPSALEEAWSAAGSPRALTLTR